MLNLALALTIWHLLLCLLGSDHPHLGDLPPSPAFCSGARGFQCKKLTEPVKGGTGGKGDIINFFTKKKIGLINPGLPVDILSEDPLLVGLQLLPAPALLPGRSEVRGDILFRLHKKISLG